MNRTITPILVALGLAITAGVAVIVVLLFANTSDSPETLGTDAGFAIDPLGSEPVDVAVMVMAGVYSWQPAVEESAWDALHSQEQYLTGPMASAAAQRPNPAPKPLSEWAAWARGGDIVSAVVQPGGEGSIDGDSATVPVTIIQTVQHIDGDITPFTTYSATVTLENDSDTWKVANYRLENASR